MDDLIIRVLAGAASPFEEERLKRWREAAEENEDHFQEISRVWSVTAPETVIPTSGPPGVEAILQAEADAQQDPTVLPMEGRRGSSAAGRPGTAAFWKAAGLLAASVAAVGLGIGINSLSGPELVATYEAGAGETPTVTLSDGSYVRLSEGSVLRELAVEGAREVALEGRGFFAVAREESRPFTVRASGGEVRVLGTRFQVDARGRSLETVVVEGLVRLSNEDGSVEVPAGQRGKILQGQEPTAQEVEDVYALLDWEDGTLVFQATPLSLVSREVSRHYGQTLQVVSPELANRRVTAWFQGEPFEAVTEALCMVVEASCSSEESGVSMDIEGGSGGV